MCCRHLSSMAIQYTNHLQGAETPEVRRKQSLFSGNHPNRGDKRES